MTSNSNISYFANLKDNVQSALSEDIGSGDITAQLIPENHQAKAVVITREDAVLCGRPWFDEVFHQLDPLVKINWKQTEGNQVSANTELVVLEGSARSILTGERTALNFLQTLMGTATTARHYAALLAGTNTKILDTRKTIPGLRLAQKYAVKTGGAENHRIGLFDAFLIKENHIAASGSIKAAVETARGINQTAQVEVEVETLDELKAAIDAGVDRVMLDNFSDAQIENAVKLKPENIQYEVSGNITDAGLIKDKLSGIDFVSSGALTKNVAAVDLSMRLHLIKSH